MSVWAGLQNLRHRMSQAFAHSQPYAPSAKEVLEARADAWKQRVMARPARKAAATTTNPLESHVKRLEKANQRLSAMLGER